MLWRASKRPNLDPDAGFGAEGRENGSKVRRQFVTIHFEASWKLSIGIYLEDSGSISIYLEDSGCDLRVPVLSN